MTKILIGSKALNHHGIFLNRNSRDIDFISSKNDAINFIQNFFDDFNLEEKLNKIHAKNNFFHVEAELNENETSKEFISLVKNDSETQMGNVFDSEFLIPSLGVLLGLKLTHRFKRSSPHFLKTMRDIQLLRSLNVKVPNSESWKNWFLKREKETLNYEHPNLNMNKKQFFKTPNVTYKYDHDSIHIAIKRGEKPAYEYFKPNSNEVFCSKEMFFNCDYQTQLNAVIEESTVLALERCIIPSNYTARPMFGYQTALKNICTGTTSGWFREFAWENYDNAIAQYDENYVDKFKEALNNNIIKPFN